MKDNEPNIVSLQISNMCLFIYTYINQIESKSCENRVVIESKNNARKNKL